MDLCFKITQSIPKSGEIRLGYVANTNDSNHRYVGVRPYLIVSNNVYNNTSGCVEAIPFTTKRFQSKNPVHIQYKKHEVEGLKMDSTLIIEGRTTLKHSQLSEPIGKFNDKNWSKAAAGLLYQTPQIKFAFEEGIQNTILFNHLLVAR